MTDRSYPDVQLMIAGQWRSGEAGETLAVSDPSSGAEIGRLAVARKADLDAARAAALMGF